MKFLVSDGSWAAFDCVFCGPTLKRPQKLKRSNIDSRVCDGCGRLARIVWGKLVSHGKDVYFVPEEQPKDLTREEPTQPGPGKKGSQP